MILTVAFPFVLAAFIAYLLYPFIHKLHENGLQWWLSVMIVYILFFGGIGYGIYKGIPVFIQQLRDLSENLPQFFAQLEGIVDTIEKKTKSWPLGIHKQINESLHVIYGELEQILDRVKNFFLWLLESIFLILLIPFIAFYMIKDISYLTDAFWSIVPKKWRKQMKIFIRNVDTSLRKLYSWAVYCICYGRYDFSISFLANKIKISIIARSCTRDDQCDPLFWPHYRSCSCSDRGCYNVHEDRYPCYCHCYCASIFRRECSIAINHGKIITNASIDDYLLNFDRW